MSIYQCVNIQNGGPFTYPDGQQLPIHDKQQALAIPKGRLNVSWNQNNKEKKNFGDPELHLRLQFSVNGHGQAEA